MWPNNIRIYVRSKVATLEAEWYYLDTPSMQPHRWQRSPWSQIALQC